MKRAIYVAHPLGQGADRELNRERAMRWVGWLADTFDIAPLADWILLAGVWGEERRHQSMDINRELIARSDGLWLAGDRITHGMHDECLLASITFKPIVDFTYLGRSEPPETSSQLFGRTYTPPRSWVAVDWAR